MSGSPQSGAAAAEALFEPAPFDPEEPGGPKRTIDETIAAMVTRLAELERRGDRRAVFQRVYLAMTRETQRRLEAGFFEDRAWMERVLVAFAGYYFEALDAYDAGRPCPPAWRLALDAARVGDAFVLEDALLGINAHINSDLPIVLAAILRNDGVWPDARLMLRRRRDHDRVNDILGELVDAVQEELTHHYAALTRLVDNLLGRSDECLSGRVMQHYRTSVWHQSELLLDASGQAEEAAVRHQIEGQALAVGRELRACLPFRLGRPLAGVSRRLRLL